MTTLLIVESPAKCKKIVSFLDDSFVCEATYGHLREFHSLKHINSQYQIEFSVIPEKKKQVEKLRRAINKSDTVILATDDDREGEGIAWHIQDLFQLPTNTKRITFNSITKDAIKESLSRPTTVNLKLVESQQARQILDLLVGFKISPILWNEISRNNHLSAGRCQTPALHILYQNHKNIQDKHPEMSYQVVGYFTGKNIKFILNKHFQDQDELVSFFSCCKNTSVLPLGVHKIENQMKQPPKPFITSTLQQTCSNILNISPKETMSICQNLYENGHITYMRTDSYYISPIFQQQCKTYIETKYGKEYCCEKYVYFNKNNAQEAHEAIRPTQIANIPTLNGKYKSVYQLIRNQTLKTLMTPAKTNIYKYTAQVNNEYNFQHSCEEIIFQGWMILDHVASTSYLPFLNALKEISWNKMIAEPQFTNTSLHYTEARLIKELEQKGIGRPSTFSSIVEKLKERKYVTKTNIEGHQISCHQYEFEDAKIKKKKFMKQVGNEKNKLVLQPLGVMVIELLMKHFEDLFNYQFTKDMENTLDSIAQGEQTKIETCKTYETHIDTLVTNWKKVDKELIMIDEQHQFIISKNGPVIKHIDGDKVSFKTIIPHFDLQKLKDGKYTIDELIDSSTKERLLGTHKEKNVMLRHGKYGPYVTYGTEKISIKSIQKQHEEIDLIDVIDLLDNNTCEGTNNIIRKINDDISVRKGKFGPYIFYKTLSMKKPKFISIKKANLDYMNCDEEEFTRVITTMD